MEAAHHGWSVLHNAIWTPLRSVLRKVCNIAGFFSERLYLVQAGISINPKKSLQYCRLNLEAFNCEAIPDSDRL